MCFYLIVDQIKLLFPRIACIVLIVLLVISCGDDTKTTESVSKNRFIANNSGVVKDTKTDLEWYAGLDESTTWDGAKRWVASLNKDEFAGGGWRMPTKEELKTLYQEGVGARNMTPLLKTTGQLVWSGKTEGSVFAWDFNFSTGSEGWANRGYSYDKRGFAVRSR
jgi:hypothetical protein